MADLGVALRTWAMAQSAITDLCSTRWHADRLPQGGAVPAVVYEIVSATEEGSLGPTRIGVTHARMQIDAYATTRSAAVALANAIRNELAQYSGMMDTVEIDGVSVDGGLRNDTEEREDGGDDPYRIASRDYMISFQDT